MNEQEFQKKWSVFLALLPIGIVLTFVLPMVVQSRSIELSIRCLGIIYLLFIVFMIVKEVRKYRKSKTMK